MTNERNNEIVRKVIDGLRAQGGYSFVEDDHGKRCRYKAGDRRCAAGLLMPDDTDFGRLEGLSVSAGVVQEALARGGAGGGTDVVLLIERLQELHDGHALDRRPLEECLASMGALLK
jgi:hypothetical protein